MTNISEFQEKAYGETVKYMLEGHYIFPLPHIPSKFQIVLSYGLIKHVTHAN